MMRDKRISVIMDARISKIEGVNKIESVIFTKNEKNESERNVEFYIRPDIVIAENGVGSPK
jgi:hypothetical protein